jgi:hypothetical protein
LAIIAGLVLISTLFDITTRIYEHLISNEEEQFVKEPDDVIKAKEAIGGSDILSKRKKKQARKPVYHQFMMNCSLYSNTLKFFRTDNGGKITCLNGIRLFSMVWIVWGHTYNYLADRAQFFLLGTYNFYCHFN